MKYDTAKQHTQKKYLEMDEGYQQGSIPVDVESRALAEK